MASGKFLSVGELWSHAQAEPEPDWHGLYGHVGLRGTAAATAVECARLRAAGEPLGELWRFGILQTLDFYQCARVSEGSCRSPPTTWSSASILPSCQVAC